MNDFDCSRTECTFDQLQRLIRHLGNGGGSMSPSIYETAQVLRFCPELVETDKVVAWLLDRQQVDGGWGEPSAPLYRHVPTLATILALNNYRDSRRVRGQLQAALKYLADQVTAIAPSVDAYLPVGMEFILPHLLHEAEEAGFGVSSTPYRHIEALGKRKRQALALYPPRPNDAPVFSWEAWGTEPSCDLVSPAGVGQSPAATAWWLHLDRGRAATCTVRQRAINYLTAASDSLGTDIRGLAPSAWPMNRFEQSFVLQMVVTTGLLHNQYLAKAVGPQLEDLQRALATGGLGFNDYFAHDGDDTAAGLAVLAAAGMAVDCSVLDPFSRPDHFVAYPFETHGSHAVTARAIQALLLAGRDATPWRRCIERAQQPDGWWASEKWNRSRLYGTSLAVAALDADSPDIKTALTAFLRYQHADGGWGCFDESTPVETAFAVLALCSIAQRTDVEIECIEAIAAARSYLRRTYNMRRIGRDLLWICKDLYSAKRVDQGAVLCALLASITPAKQHVYHRGAPKASVATIAVA